MNKKTIIFLSSIVLLCFCGCQSSKDKRLELPSSDTIYSMIPYQVKALEHEKNNELQLALSNWRIAESLLYQKISTLTELIENSAEKHFQRGITFHNLGLKDQAKQEFLKTLRYDSNHGEALKYLKRMSSTSHIEYTVVAGDTFHNIAAAVYKNVKNDFIVRYFSGLKNEKELVSGLVIILPKLEVDFTRRFFNYKKELLIARKIFKEKDFVALLPIAENILKHVPENEEARFMVNSSCYKIGEKYYKDSNFTSSIEMLRRVDPKFKNVNKKIAEIELARDEMIETAAENMNKHYYHMGRKLYKEENYILALEILEKVESNYADVGDIILELKAVMKGESELYYRNGVKCFLNENLDEAIIEWNKSLAFDPQNRKAQRDIENARMLLEKISEVH